MTHAEKRRNLTMIVPAMAVAAWGLFGAIGWMLASMG